MLDPHLAQDLQLRERVQARRGVGGVHGLEQAYPAPADPFCRFVRGSGKRESLARVA
ncbi:hypothetical protein Spla01_06153 [Streptomyces platensis]|uniref:DUF397 domain-containing protein n=1 Tax=Streptomyces platensis TaxID=58346 RepID=A0ABX3XWI2_STRPT|nr:hypothetical protein BG653_03703 [Streptomyces platensis]